MSTICLHSNQRILNLDITDGVFSRGGGLDGNISVTAVTTSSTRLRTKTYRSLIVLYLVVLRIQQRQQVCRLYQADQYDLSNLLSLCISFSSSPKESYMYYPHIRSTRHPQVSPLPSISLLIWTTGSLYVCFAQIDYLCEWSENVHSYRTDVWYRYI